MADPHPHEPAPPTDGSDPNRAITRLGGRRMRTVGRRASLAVSGGLAILSVVWLTKAGISAILWAVLLWLYLCCAVFAVVATVGRFRGFVPDIPGLPDRINGDPKLIAGAAAVVMVVTLVREGALAPTFILNLNWWNASHTVRHNASSNSSTTGELSFAGRPVFCSLTCTGDEVGCQVFRAIITCDDRSAAPRGVSVMGTVSIPEVSCYTPLSKSEDVAFSANLSFRALDGQSRKSSSLNIIGNATLEMTGLASCHVFRQELAKVISHEVASLIDSHLATN